MSALALLALAASSSAPPDLEGILEALRRPETVVARFTQTKRHPAFEAPQVSTGRVFLARPDRLDFVYERPHQVELSLRKTTLRMRYPRSGRTQTLDLADDPKLGLVFDTLRFFVDADPARLEARYDVQIEGGALLLVPKDPGLKRMLSRVRAVPDASRGILRRVELVQSDGSRTVIEFSDVRIDAPAPGSPRAPPPP